VSVTPDGKVLIVGTGEIPGFDNTNDYRIKAYSLPSFNPLWTSTATDTVISVSQSAVLVQSENRDGSYSLAALSAATGPREWGL
jgi:hypothetical protein